MLSGRYFFAAAACATGALPASAAFVVDSTIFRLDGGTPSNFQDDSATIDSVRFSVGAPGDVVIDLLSWEFDERVGSPTFGQAVDLNKNGRIAFFDTDIVLFREGDDPLSLADFVSENDDSPLDGFGDGSIDPLGRDSFLALTLQPGVYVLAVSVSDLTAKGAVAGMTAIKGEGPVSVMGGDTVPSGFGDYRLTVTGDAELLGVTSLPVPLPGSAGLGMLGLAGVGAVAVSRRGRGGRRGAAGRRGV